MSSRLVTGRLVTGRVDAKRAYLRFGTTITRKVDDQLILEIFDLPADSMFETNAILDRLFLPQRLRLLVAGEDNELDHVEIRSLRIAGQEQLAVDRISARLFGASAFGVSLLLPSADKGETISIRLRSLLPTPLKLAMFLEGQS